MGVLKKKLLEDIRFEEGLQACMNCGICTAICPAAEFYDYDPRQIVNTVQTADDETLIELMKSETIWYCGQCMSCRTRCPRNNTPGYVIMALRKLSQEMGFFTESEKGRQQLYLKRTVGDNVLKYGYCIYPKEVKPEIHPEQGPIWEWIHENRTMVYDRMGGNLDKPGEGPLRAIDKETLNELDSIFEVTGNN
ncbi:MAG: 4Fe-4S dicluster domain-containing protein, partial [Salinivirgaceae bacterium]|nr:4Fe-4S dicluster domain-containing protein [Salinivirgaceae bacterium]